MYSWMFDSRSAFGSRVQTPCGPRKSGMPDSVEMPAPVNATMDSASSTQAATDSIRESLATKSTRYPLCSSWLPAGERPDDQEGFGATHHGLRQWGIGRVVRQVLLARIEAHERPAPERGLVADRAAQHRVTRLERIEHRALRHRTGHVDLDLSADPRERLQMLWQGNADHDSVCTSTDSTGGRSRTIAFQLSPAF